MKIKILKDPAGPYNLSLYPGEVVDLSSEKAKELIESGHAVATSENIGHDFKGFTFGSEDKGRDAQGLEIKKK